MMDNESSPDLPLSQFEPRACLTVPGTEISRPRFPAIDAHNHLGSEFGGGWDRRPVSDLLDVLDEAGVQVLVDLDGGWGEDILESHLDRFKAAAPERFLHFGGVDWSRWPEYGDRFGEWAAGRLRDQARRGAQGLKIWKNLGLHVKDQHGDQVGVDDPRLDPLWAAAGALGLPVLIHVADPVAFFQPLDRHNERWEELHAHRDWHFPSPPFPPFSTIIEALSRVVLRHPGTTFIGAHVGCYAENLGWVGDLLDQAPNFFVDIGARLGELGRQPYSARAFFLQHSSRILFGTDVPASLKSYRLYYRFLETQDEYFNYSLGPLPDQGRWYIYGLDLPEEVLQQVYAANAREVLGLNR
jgi:predicted TIM-barrel fold metal-dependent hydrolase